VCHPVASPTGGNQHNGYSLISPDHASSHIDEALYPDGVYWKHEAGGRHDVYANEDGTCGEPPVESKYPYEVQVCWTMEHSDGVENTYEFPQTRGCDTQPPCESSLEFQHDTYWIRDEADENYLANLTTLNSPADDAQLEPHDYYSNIVTNDEKCVGPQPPPIITTQHIEHHYKCSLYYSTDDITTTIEYVLVDGEWVQGEPQVVDVFNTWIDPNYDPSKCEHHNPHHPPHHNPPNPAPPVKHHTPTQPAVPTVIEAGL
jgi:hypothetical protein